MLVELCVKALWCQVLIQLQVHRTTAESPRFTNKRTLTLHRWGRGWD